MRRKLVLVQLKGGLGNQMFQYAFGRALAKEQHAQLVFDLSWFKTQTMRTFELGGFNIKDFTTFEEDTLNKIRLVCDLPSPSKYPKPARFGKWFYRKLLYRNFHPILEKEPGLYESFHLIPTHSYYLIGYWQSEKFFKNFSHLIKKDFSPRAPLSENDQKLAQLMNDDENSVSMHIRRGDYVSTEKSFSKHFVCTPKYYENAINLLCNKLGSKVNLYVFSDDPEWCQTNLQFRYPTVIVSDSDNKRDSVHELFLLSKCNHHIIANSSFSWWGAWLSDNKHKIIIAPGKWLSRKSGEMNIEKRDYYTMPDITPKNWIRIDVSKNGNSKEYIDR